MDAVLGPDYHYGVLVGYLLGQGAPEGIYSAAEALHAAAVQLATEIRSETRIDEPTLEDTPSPIVEHATEANESPSIVPPGVGKSDEAKIEAFLNAKAATEREVGVTGVCTQKKRRAWSPEARAAASERMRAMRATGVIKKRSAGVEPQAVPEDAPRPIIVKHGKPSEHIRVAERVSLAKPEPLAEPPAPHRLAISHPDWAGKREDGQLHDTDWPDVREMLAKGRSRRTIAGDFDVDPETLDAFISARQQTKEATSPAGEALAPLA